MDVANVDLAPVDIVRAVSGTHLLLSQGVLKFLTLSTDTVSKVGDVMTSQPCAQEPILELPELLSFPTYSETVLLC